jgi:hypothetical protein
MSTIMSFFSKKTPDSLEELHTKVLVNEKVSFNTKNELDLRVKLWNHSIKEAQDLLREAATPIERFTSMSLNAMPNTNFQGMSSGFLQKASFLLSSIPKEKIELLAVVVKLNPQYPGIYEKMQTVLTDQSKGILDSLRSKVKILQNAKTRRNSKKGQAAANSLKARLNAIRRQGGRRKTLRRRKP